MKAETKILIGVALIISITFVVTMLIVLDEDYNCYYDLTYEYKDTKCKRYRVSFSESNLWECDNDLQYSNPEGVITHRKKVCRE